MYSEFKYVSSEAPSTAHAGHQCLACPRAAFVCSFGLRPMRGPMREWAWQGLPGFFVAIRRWESLGCFGGAALVTDIEFLLLRPACSSHHDGEAQPPTANHRNSTMHTEWCLREGSIWHKWHEHSACPAASTVNASCARLEDSLRRLQLLGHPFIDFLWVCPDFPWS